MKKLLFITLLLLTLSPSQVSANRLHTTGFEQNTALVLSPTASDLTKGTTGLAISTTTVRSGTYAARLSSLSSGVTKSVGPQFILNNDNGPFFIRYYLRITTLPSAENRIFAIRDSTDVAMVYHTIDDTGAIKLYDEDGQITGTTTLSVDTWYRIETQFDASPVAGSHVVNARVDGTDFATSSTRSISTGVNHFIVGGNIASEAQTTGDWFFDDIAVNNDAGTAQTSYPGEGKIVNAFPNPTKNKK